MIQFAEIVIHYHPYAIFQSDWIKIWKTMYEATPEYQISCKRWEVEVMGEIALKT